MCSPALIAGGQAAIAIGSQVTSYIGQKQAFSANRTAANYDFANRSNILEQSRVQLDQERSEKVFDTAITGLVEGGRIAASVGDMGAADSSVVAMLNTGMFGLGRNAAVEGAIDQNKRNQLGTEKTGAAIARTSKINSMAKPSGLALALGIGKSIGDAASSYMSAGGGKG